MTRDEKQILNTTSRKCRIITAVSLCVVIGLGIAKMVVANRAATWGEQVDAVASKSEAVRQENLRLKAELAARGGGLETLSAAAEAAGFTSDVTVLYFAPPQPVALNLP